jgi:hypothetical protein
VQRSSVLSAADIAHFLERGYVKLRGCFSRSFATYLTDFNWRRSGLDRHAPETWPSSRVRYPPRHRAEFPEAFPKLWEAVCTLVGGPERLASPCRWHDGFHVNYRLLPERDPDAAAATELNWHIDGDRHRIFLDETGEAIVPFMLFSDVEPGAGGSMLALDSVGHIARHLRDQREGVLPSAMPYAEIFARCREFLEVTGEIGDVYLLHPMMLHRASPNPSGRARFQSVPHMAASGPFDLARPDPRDRSPVERAILNALGVERFVFRRGAPREVLEDPRASALHRRLARFLEHEATAAADSPAPDLASLVY